MRKMFSLVFLLFLTPVAGGAADRDFRLMAPAVLVESGLLKHLLPRFSLKTQIRIDLTEGEAEVVLTPDGDGQPVFTGAGATWRMRVQEGHAGAARFADWLSSEVGQRTVTSYSVDGAQPFSLPHAEVETAPVETYDGDADAGLKLSSVHCGRCHVVSEANRMNAIARPPRSTYCAAWGTGITVSARSLP